MAGRTALELDIEDWLEFHPARAKGAQPDPDRWKLAWEVAQKAAVWLRTRFGATRVVVFGSLARRSDFGRYSDIDLAVWGVPFEKYLQAVAELTDFNPDFKIDLIPGEMVKERIQKLIDEEGVPL